MDHEPEDHALLPGARTDRRDVSISVVIVSWNTAALTSACLRALESDDTARSREIIVVDNASADGTADLVAREHPEVRLVRNRENRLYAPACNQGVARARGRYVCLLGSDAKVRPGALDQLCAFLDAHPEYGAVAPKLVGEDGVVQRTCARFPGLAMALAYSTPLRHLAIGARVCAHTRMDDFDHEESRDVDQPPTSCLVIRKDDWDELGGFDARLGLYFNDVDLCRRLWERGRRIRYLAEVAVEHEAGGSTSRARSFERNVVWHRDRLTYYEKRYGNVGALWLRGVLLAEVSEIAARIVAARTRDAVVQLAGIGRQLRRTLGREAPRITTIEGGTGTPAPHARPAAA